VLLVKNCNNAPWGLASRAGCVLILFAGLAVLPEVASISPTRGPEGTRVQIVGKNLQNVSGVQFGKTPATFHPG
jgi:hypothetical protein